MSEVTYRKAKMSDFFDWKQLLVVGGLLLAAIIYSFFSMDTDFESDVVDISDIAEYSGEAYIEINDNEPVFGEIDPEQGFYEIYSDLDDLGRCGVALASINQKLMPTEERGDISSVTPSGWQSVTYDFVDGSYLYNRCHLIGFQLTGENANEKNLITGTRYLNIEGMLPFENMVADYIKETGNTVLYRVTPIFVDEELIARGVQMEAYSLEDNGEGICFNVFCYNVQPGIEIDYATGESQTAEFTCEHEDQIYVLNTSSGKYHLPECSGAQNISEDNRQEFTGCYEELELKGYLACGTCKPAA